MTQTFRSRSDQISAAFTQDEETFAFLDDMDSAQFRKELLEAEARGAAEQRREDAEACDFIYQIEHEDGVWHEYSPGFWKDAEYPDDRKRILYTHPANVVALEARVKELEEALEGLTRAVSYRISFHEFNGPHLTCADGDFIRMDIFESWADDLETARAALKREGGEP